MNPPLPFVLELLSQVPAESTVLDLACGKGRHTRACLERGHRVTAVDINVSGLEDLKGDSNLQIVEADLETAPWPLDGKTFGLVIVTNYLWRPLLPMIGDAVRPRGFICYETFAMGNEKYGKPSNPKFLLKKDELLRTFSSEFRTMHYWHGVDQDPKPAVRQRFAGQRKVVPSD